MIFHKVFQPDELHEISPHLLVLLRCLPLLINTRSLETKLIPMDEGTIKTQNPKCRLYWCLIEFIDWRYSQSCWYFRPLCELVPLYLLSDLPHPSPTSQSKRTVYETVFGCGGGGWGGVELCCIPYSAGV
jgi:hypothetical protein